MHTFAFAAGGFLPKSQGGKALGGMIHICDFYKTFLAIAGGDGTDSGGPAPLDSVDQSGYILGTASSSARTVMVHDHYNHNSAQQEHEGAARQPVAVDASAFSAPVAVTLQTFYTGGGCGEHFSNHFWLKTADLQAVKGLPSKGSSVGALTINGEAVDIQKLGPSKAGSGCAGCCDGCPLTIFQINPFTVSDLNLHPGSNVTISFSSKPVPAPPPAPPLPKATGAIRLGDYKLLVGPQRMATWFGASPGTQTQDTSLVVLCELVS